ncbi:MAG: glycosyltransferase family 2 protein [Ilumatobacteraceae bacterium]
MIRWHLGLKLVGGAARGVTTTIVGYLGVISAAALTGKPDDTLIGYAALVGHSTRFAIMVPAHDEAAVIEQALRSFAALDYPSDLFDVHVVADNCSDDTAAKARRAGATVHERTDPLSPGKGPALNWLHDRLATHGYEVFVVVDADTSLDPQFLSAIETAFIEGAAAAQGFYGVRDPGASTAAGLRYAALACRHHLRPLGRTALGGSCGLYGNGMAFSAAILDGRRWSGHLTEDIEFQMELLHDGHLVAYVPTARLEAEMPDTLNAATTQNERWELGRLQMARRYVPALARDATHSDAAGRTVTGHTLCRARLDAIFDHLVPPLSVTVALQGLTTAASVVTWLYRRDRRSALRLAVDTGGCAVLVAHVLAGLRFVEAPPAVYRALRGAPRMLLWKVRLWLRVLHSPRRVSWTRTIRNTTGTSGDTAGLESSATTRPEQVAG